MKGILGVLVIVGTVLALLSGEGDTQAQNDTSASQVESGFVQQEEEPLHESVIEEDDQPVVEKKVIDATSEEYKKLILNTAVAVTNQTEYFAYSQSWGRYPYIQMRFVQTKVCDEETLKTELKNTIKTLLDELKKYEYKRGAWYKYCYEYINLSVLQYNSLGHTKEIAFIQINVFDLESISEENLGIYI